MSAGPLDIDPVRLAGESDFMESNLWLAPSRTRGIVAILHRDSALRVDWDDDLDEAVRKVSGPVPEVLIPCPGYEEQGPDRMTGQQAVDLLAEANWLDPEIRPDPPSTVAGKLALEQPAERWLTLAFASLAIVAAALSLWLVTILFLIATSARLEYLTLLPARTKAEGRPYRMVATGIGMGSAAAAILLSLARAIGV